MTYSEILTCLSDELKTIPNVTTVTTGNIDDVDLAKKTKFPLVHLMVTGFIDSDGHTTYNMAALFMDISLDKKDGTEQEIEVLQKMQGVVNQFLNSLRSGSLYLDGVQLVGDVTAEKFVERFENSQAGWVIDFSVMVSKTLCYV